MDGFGMRSMDTTGERFEGWFTAGALQSGLHILGDGRKVLVQHSDMTAALDTTTGAAAWRTHPSDADHLAAMEAQIRRMLALLRPPLEFIKRELLHEVARPPPVSGALSSSEVNT